jgi:glycosyltransferase involved in cell wall biosynthesis
MESARNKPLISIITVVFNGSETIESTIQSVLCQSYLDIEFVVVDGKSTDDTLSTLQKYETKIDVLVSEPDQGIYDAMNKGIAKASGDWLLFLNAGDHFYDNSTIEKFVNFLEINRSYELIFGDVFIINKDGTKYIGYLKNNIPFLIRKMICHQCIFYSKEIFSRIGLFDTKYRLSADFEHLLRVKYGGLRIAKIPEIIVRYKLDGISAERKNINAIWKERLDMFSRVPANMNFATLAIFWLYAKVAFEIRKLLR